MAPRRRASLTLWAVRIVTERLPGQRWRWQIHSHSITRAAQARSW
jgi:hypothetical protein